MKHSDILDNIHKSNIEFSDEFTIIETLYNEIISKIPEINGKRHIVAANHVCNLPFSFVEKIVIRLNVNIIENPIITDKTCFEGKSTIKTLKLDSFGKFDELEIIGNINASIHNIKYCIYSILTHEYINAFSKYKAIKENNVKGLVPIYLDKKRKRLLFNSGSIPFNKLGELIYSHYKTNTDYFRNEVKTAYKNMHKVFTWEKYEIQPFKEGESAYKFLINYKDDEYTKNQLIWWCKAYLVEENIKNWNDFVEFITNMRNNVLDNYECAMSYAIESEIIDTMMTPPIQYAKLQKEITQ